MRRFALLALVSISLAACASREIDQTNVGVVEPPAYPSATSAPPADDADGIEQRGTASYYRDDFEGKKTASGEIFRHDRLTAASPTLPMGTRVTVTNEDNGRSVDVRINDRGPFIGGRVIDVTKAAAQKLGMKRSGLANVRITKTAATAEPDRPRQEASDR